MGDSKNYAKVGVFLLLGINVAAYYFFWPKHPAAIKDSKAAREERGEAFLRPAQAVTPVETPKPKELSPNVRQEAAPLQPTEPIKKIDGPATGEDEVIRKLLDHIRRNDAAPATQWGNEKKAGEAKPAKDIVFQPMLPIGDSPRALPDLKVDPIDTSKVGVTSPLTPKLPTSPWFLYQEPAGKQTVLIGKLQPTPTAAPLAEFRILCDRVETKSAANEIVAIGHVAFTGAGLRGQCGRLTLPLLEPMLIFDDSVHIEHEAGLAPCRGERIFWGPMAMPQVTPPPRPLLGAPK